MIDLGAAGCILGVLFAQGSSKRCESLSDHALLDSAPEELAAWLISHCWGGYLAILAHPQTGALNAVVDPSGLLPVYCLETSTHTVLTSHPGLLIQACHLELRVSKAGLYRYLSRPELRQRTTCLEGVSELTPGSLVSLGHGQRSRTQIWCPEDFITRNCSMHFDAAAHDLQNISLFVINAWAEFLGPVAVAASGGVDSSLVCAALAGGDQTFSCVTVATSDPSGDERTYARLLAHHLNVPSVEKFYDTGQFNPRYSASSGLARPNRKSFLAALDNLLADAARDLGACTVFDGNGGDNLFCFLHSAAPVTDRLRREGLGAGAIASFFDVCRLTGCDVPTMMLAVLRRLVARSATDVWQADRRLLAQAHDIDDIVEPLTPWLDNAPRAKNGKYDHLALIMRAQNHAHGLTSGLSRFSPLMSQPLVEFCLSVPTWLWCTGGTNRALARMAFADQLPREILVRTAKSGPDSFIRGCFALYRDTIREQLNEGVLAHHGLLDLAQLDAALQVDPFAGDSILYRVLDLTEAENWARSWDGFSS